MITKNNKHELKNRVKLTSDQLRLMVNELVIDQKRPHQTYSQVRLCICVADKPVSLWNCMAFVGVSGISSAAKRVNEKIKAMGLRIDSYRDDKGVLTYAFFRGAK